ncbi:hypothetical protein LIER_07898 [Lithospermum erythrorhizon]|uniref:Uncharacterized protein n=1 Tax=Lithospermum erythrorhizon TaxID=34254 RepID=A0AAV3PCM8_LITER
METHFGQCKRIKHVNQDPYNWFLGVCVLWCLVKCFLMLVYDPPQDPDPLCLLNRQVRAPKSAVLAGAGAQVAVEVHPGRDIVIGVAAVAAVKWCLL